MLDSGARALAEIFAEGGVGAVTPVWSDFGHVTETDEMLAQVRPG